MARLPQPGADNGTWGDVLNDFLEVEHNNDGTLKASGSLSTKADDSTVVHNTGSETISGTKTFSASPVVPTPTLGSEAANKTYVDTTVSAGTPDATTSTKGKVQLAGDLGGTASSPTVPGLAGKENTIAAGTSSQYWRGDKSWQTLDKSTVGLSNVDNTSDANKPVSAAQQTALNAKADDTAVLHKAGAETVSGSKDFTGGITVNGSNVITQSFATTKGDILAATSASSLSRFGIGTDGQVLTADSTQAAGMKWSIQASIYVTAATGTGSTDRSNLQAAINAASTAAGGKGYVDVRLTPGAAYHLDQSLIVKSNVRIIGGTVICDFSGMAIKNDSTTSATITNFAIQGITFEGPVVEVPTSPKRSRDGGSVATGMQNALWIFGSGMTGSASPPNPAYPTVTNIDVIDCVFRNMWAQPVQLSGVSGRARMIRNSFYNTMDPGCIFCDEAVFSDNYVYASADNGVSMSRGNKRVVVVGNSIENCAYNGIWIAGFNNDIGPINFTVAGNTVKNVGYNGIYADLAPQYGTITGNEVDCGYFRGPSDGPSDIYGAGIFVGGYPSFSSTPTTFAQGVVVSSNHIRTAARVGVYLNGVKRVQVEGNQISDVGTQFKADGTTAISSSDATQNIGVFLDNASSSADVTIGMNSIVDSRGTPYTNYGVVPQNVSTANAYWNTMVNCRNALNLYETGPTRTFNMTAVFNFNTKHVLGATTGSNAGTGTIAGFDTNGAAGSIRPMKFLTGGVERWRVQAGSGSESGSNVGSDLEVRSYDDSGNALASPMTITRVGTVTLGVAGKAVTLNGRRVSGASAATVAAGGQAASAAAASNGANDSSGYVNVTAVASPVAGTIATITYSTAYSTTPKVTLTPRNAATAAANLYVTTESTGGFSVATANAAGASASLSFGYHVEG